MDKDKILLIVGTIAILLLVYVAWALHGYDSRGNDNDVGSSIQSTQDASKRVGAEISNTERELANGQATAGRIDAGLDELADGAVERSELIDECEQIISGIEQLFADIDEQNSGTGKDEQATRTTT